MYRRLTDGKWTEANDIVFARGENGRLSNPQVVADEYGYLNLIWEQDAKLWFSSAPGWDANRAPVWHKKLNCPKNFAVSLVEKRRSRSIVNFQGMWQDFTQYVLSVVYRKSQT